MGHNPCAESTGRKPDMSAFYGTFPGMGRFGYARVSARGQKDDSQIDALTAAGCDGIWVDKVSGKLARRPERDKCFERLRRGDELVITPGRRPRSSPKRSATTTTRPPAPPPKSPRPGAATPPVPAPGNRRAGHLFATVDYEPLSVRDPCRSRRATATSSLPHHLRAVQWPRRCWVGRSSTAVPATRTVRVGSCVGSPNRIRRQKLRVGPGRVPGASS